MGPRRNYCNSRWVGWSAAFGALLLAAQLGNAQLPSSGKIEAIARVIDTREQWASLRSVVSAPEASAPLVSPAQAPRSPFHPSAPVLRIIVTIHYLKN